MRATALYEQVQGKKVSRHYKRNTHDRDVSGYQVDESAPTEGYFQDILKHLLSLAAPRYDTLATMRKYLGLWAWLSKMWTFDIKRACNKRSSFSAQCSTHVGYQAARY